MKELSFLFFYFFFVALGIKPMVCCMLGRCFTTSHTLGHHEGPIAARAAVAPSHNWVSQRGREKARVFRAGGLTSWVPATASSTRPGSLSGACEA